MGGVALLGCASDSGDTDRGPGSSSSGGSAGTTGGGGDDATPQGTGGGTFGNPDKLAPMTQLPMPGTDDMTTDGPLPGECEVGQFCAPTSPDPDNCGTLEFAPDVEIIRSPGNLLVIFDQSGSMNDNWSGAGTKLQAAQMALVNAVTPLAADLTVGAIFFPTNICVLAPPMGGAVASMDTANVQIPFMPGADFLTAWQQHWANFGGGVGIGTPMQEAFDRADVAIQNATLDGPLAIVAFTDGAPNCFPTEDLTGIPTQLEPARAASWLTNLEVKTYMVGLPGAGGVQILNDVATQGGTGQYILPDDPAALEATLREVVQETVKTGFQTCSMTLDPIPDVPDDLLMIVDDPTNGVAQVPRDRGWSLTVDSTEARVDITGSLCDAATEGRFNSIKFQYACPEAEPPPALPPLE